MPSKPWYQSSTVIINLIGIAVLILTMFVNTRITNDQDIIAIVLAIINILNRVRSSISPLTIK